MGVVLSKKKLTSFQIIIIGFSSVILLGTLLLMLPISSRTGEFTSFADALFTSTSAVCVTGLIVFDTATYWSLFGQFVIMLLIEIGGMGVITVAASFAMIAGRKISLMQRSTMQEAIAAPKVGGIVRLTIFVIKATLMIELLGAVAMSPVFCRDFGIKGLWMALFHSGAYSLILMSSAKMIAVRDPYGFRPLCYGKMPDGSYVIASESCALTSVGAELIRDLLPGEILVFSEEGVESRREHCDTQKQKTCIFEYIYFARPDSVIDKISVSAARIQAGKLLAQTKPVKADIVIGVPDSGLDAALGFSEVSGIPYGIGLVKNKYIGRTFISPGQKERIDLVRMKLSPIPSVIQGKRVVLIDDSIVRGTTSRQLVSLLREAGAKEIHLRISAPPFLHPCYYGTDIDSEENLIASHHGEKEVATLIGADSLGYLPLECLHELTGTHSYCDACFSGKYATEIPTDVRKDRFEQKLSER